MSTSEKELIAGFAKACKVYDTESFNKKIKYTRVLSEKLNIK